ncbi:DNA methylase N-4/N-6 domain protein [Methanohalobium evestigatum Z-7303]|uniref:Type II methyltransferase n=1 Tax=Methanohalobium evestigatum (strain ATCC BAA-1072 / DSM 3721 / NBRC 107634 / OCM 161 / Z-7303) TaxID=644295 RepID=D7E6P2_METEZ|nr:site-specific DNA-methyltransferase [Methanohalobium evestigatum]ADI73264.1 DNA methylase N-4/N-6 domain protein [Methanohalobium evestigatum Z-7303]
MNHYKKLYYTSQEGKVKLYQDDALDFIKGLPENSVDIIVTDPAYSGMNQKMKFGNGRIVGEYKNENNNKWFQEFHDTEDNYRYFLSQCYKVLKDNSHIYIMFDSYSLLSLGNLLREYFNVKNIIVWDKVNMGMGHYFRRRHEFVIFATKGNKKLISRSIPDVWRFKRIYNKCYPTQKPVELFEAMLAGSVDNENLTVCDPFVGSGSSAIAALKKNCNFIGNDTDEKALKTSSERIDSFLKTENDIYQKKPSNMPGDKIFW